VTDTSPPQIDAVLFDYGLVLSAAPDPAAWARMRAITGLEEDALHAGYWAHRHDYDRGTLTGVAYWHAVVAHAGIALDAAQLAGLLVADTDLWTQLNLPMVEWAGRLQAASIRTGILSNIGDSMAEGICAKFPWLSRFDHCTWSHALFLAKPEPAIYIKTAETLKTPPANILFIDDREENIAAADALGFQTIRYTGHAEFEREMRGRGLGWLLDVGTPGATSAAESEPAHT
jgi:putative hydrolase of the HAD superfamily